MLTGKGAQANLQNETGPGSGNPNGQTSRMLDQQSRQRKSRIHETREMGSDERACGVQDAYFLGLSAGGFAHEARVMTGILAAFVAIALTRNVAHLTLDRKLPDGRFSLPA